MLPLIYLVGAGIAGLLLVATKGYFEWGKDENGEPITKKKLAVFGPNGCGKTSFFDALKGTIKNGPYRSTGISGDEIEELIIQYGEKTLILQSTIDVPGTNSSIILHFEKLINESSDFFFILNCKMFLEEESYKDDTMSMIDFIIRHNNQKKQIILLGSHIDTLLKEKDSEDSRKEVSKEIMNILALRFDLQVLRKIELINLTDKEEISTIKKALFK